MSGCLVFIIGLIVLALFVSYPVPAIIITVVLIIIGVVNSQEKGRQEKENRKLQDEAEERAKKGYDSIKSSITIPENAKEVYYKKGYVKILDYFNYIWIEDGNLCLFPKYYPFVDSPEIISKIIIYKLPISRIEYFVTQGEIFRENRITGGGGGGSSVGGAVVGAVVAGEVGAVIGSRKKVQSIKSELVTHDARETYINFFDEDGNKHSMFFRYEDYSIFNELIPEKAFEIVNTIKTNNILQKVVNENKTSIITEQIRELAKLKDEGILTEDEFNKKKDDLLKKI